MSEADSWNYVTSGSSLHSLDNGYQKDPEIVYKRPIGFNVDLDTKPIYRVKCKTRKEAE